MLKKITIHLKNLITFVVKYRKHVVIIILVACCLVIMCWPRSPIVGPKTKPQSYERETLIQRRIQLKSLLQCHDKRLTTEIHHYGKFWVLKNLIRGRLSTNMGCAESITYTTIGDYMFMGHVAVVVKRWLGPVSFALFSPGHDFNHTMDAIQYARHCLAESPLIRDYVSFHLYFPYEHAPKFRLPTTEVEALKWPYNCQAAKAPYHNVPRMSMYKSQANLTYPINMARNIARKAANTYFVFPCDIELYPSRGLIDQFLEMAHNNISSVLGSGNKTRVFPLAVFELHSSAKLPDSKSELLAMLNSQMAIPFHLNVCANYHRLPEYEKWLMANVSGGRLEVLTVSKRLGKYAFWEPFYISDNKEPVFEERVSWEGGSDKRIQNYAMCLLNYDYHILHPAFLVHAPGIKVGKPNKRLQPYIKAMNQVIYRIILPEYSKLYGNNRFCRV